MLTGNGHQLRSHPRLQLCQLFSSIHEGLAPGGQDKRKCIETAGNFHRLSGSALIIMSNFS